MKEVTKAVEVSAHDLEATKLKITPKDIDGMSSLEALVFLGGKGMAAKMAIAFQKAHKTTRKAGFASTFYDALRAGPMNDATFEKMLKDSESNNVMNHKSHYKAIRDLANDIHNA